MGGSAYGGGSRGPGGMVRPYGRGYEGMGMGGMGGYNKPGIAPPSVPNSYGGTPGTPGGNSGGPSLGGPLPPYQGGPGNRGDEGLNYGYSKVLGRGNEGFGFGQNLQDLGKNPNDGWGIGGGGSPNYGHQLSGSGMGFGFGMGNPTPAFREGPLPGRGNEGFGMGGWNGISDVGGGMPSRLPGRGNEGMGMGGGMYTPTAPAPGGMFNGGTAGGGMYKPTAPAPSASFNGGTSGMNFGNYKPLPYSNNMRPMGRGGFPGSGWR